MATCPFEEVDANIRATGARIDYSAFLISPSYYISVWLLHMQTDCAHVIALLELSLSTRSDICIDIHER